MLEIDVTHANEFNPHMLRPQTYTRTEKLYLQFVGSDVPGKDIWINRPGAIRPKGSVKFVGEEVIIDLVAPYYPESSPNVPVFERYRYNGTYKLKTSQ